MHTLRNVARASIALIILTTAVNALVAPAAAQNPVPVISLVMTPGERVAEITASQPDAVSFSGNYTADKLSFERATVTFTAVMSTGWVATVSPASITITNQRTGIITITVVVPARTLASEIGQLTVTGRITAGGLQSQAQAQAIVSPKAYFRTIASSSTPFVETAYSTQVVLAYKIFNEGNVPDRVEVAIKNFDDLSAAQWIVQMSRTSFTVEPTLSVDIQVTVGVPKEWHLVSDNKVTVIQFVAKSGEGAANNQPFEDTLPTFVRTSGFSVPGFDGVFVVMGAALAAVLAGSANGSRRRLVK
jgi:hypothetical protein